jgi:hypothetical protein
MTFKFPTVESFFTDNDLELKETQTKLKAQKTISDSTLAAIYAEPPIATLELNIQDIANGVAFEVPKSKDARITELKAQNRDINDAMDITAKAQMQGWLRAAKRLIENMRPEHDVFEKKLIEALVVVHELHLEYFRAKRHLINNGIPTFGLFTNRVDEVLGVPVNQHTAIASVFREAVKAGHLSKMPEGLR